MAHEKWYKKYLELKEKQKAAIHAWRTTKNNSLNSNSRNCISAPASKVKTRFPVNKITKQQIAIWKVSKLITKSMYFNCFIIFFSKKEKKKSKKNLKISV